MDTDIIKRRTNFSRVSIYFVFVILTGYKSQSPSPGQIPICVIKEDNISPKFEGVEAISQYTDSKFDIDVMIMHANLRESSSFNFGRVYRNSNKWFYQNSQLTKEIDPLDTIDLSFLREVKNMSRHLLSTCDSKSLNYDTFIYLFSVNGELRQSLISDVTLDRISNKEEKGDVLSVLSLFGKVHSTMTKVASK